MCWRVKAWWCAAAPEFESALKQLNLEVSAIGMRADGELRAQPGGGCAARRGRCCQPSGRRPILHC
jgi:hypothetical protein